jgi:hypothetical protein
MFSHVFVLCGTSYLICREPKLVIVACGLRSPLRAAAIPDNPSLWSKLLEPSKLFLNLCNSELLHVSKNTSTPRTEYLPTYLDR